MNRFPSILGREEGPRCWECGARGCDCEPDEDNTIVPGRRNNLERVAEDKTLLRDGNAVRADWLNTRNGASPDAGSNPAALTNNQKGKP